MGLARGVTMEVKDSSKMEKIRQREVEIAKERVQLILKSGANVVFTTKGIEDQCLKYFIEVGAIAVRRCLKDDLRRIARATGAKLVTSLADAEDPTLESFSASNLGSAEQVVQERVADQELLVVKGGKKSKISSIILRGPNRVMLDETSRSLHDALSIVKRTLESGTVVPGGGAVEAGLNIYLENFARTLGSRNQLAIAEFAEALLIIPKTLAVNAAMDAADLVAALRVAHHNAQKAPKKSDLNMSGLDLTEGKIRR